MRVQAVSSSEGSTLMDGLAWSSIDEVISDGVTNDDDDTVQVLRTLKCALKCVGAQSSPPPAIVIAPLRTRLVLRMQNML